MFCATGTGQQSCRHATVNEVFFDKTAAVVQAAWYYVSTRMRRGTYKVTLHATAIPLPAPDGYAVSAGCLLARRQETPSPSPPFRSKTFQEADCL